MTTEAYSEVLETGREKLSEGDYLKLATFLQGLATTATVIAPTGITTSEINTTITFDTLADKHYEVNIERVSRAYYSSQPCKDTVYGTINGVAFNDKDNDMIRKMVRFSSMYGIKNITRTMQGFDTQTWTKLYDFKKHIEASERNDNDSDDEDEDDERNADSYTPNYVMGCLFCLFWIY